QRRSGGTYKCRRAAPRHSPPGGSGAQRRSGGTYKRRRAAPRREMLPLGGQRSGVSRKRGGHAVSAFLAEPAWTHGQPRRVGVLLLNLGTPDAPTAAAVRRYLAEFLADRRVVEIPAFIWKPILHLVILRVRPARSARKYAMIWGSDGSPLLAHSLKQKTLLLGYLGQRLKDRGLPSDFAPVELAMRYGNPGIADALGRLRAAGCDRILAVPLFPQHSSSAT